MRTLGLALVAILALSLAGGATVVTLVAGQYYDAGWVEVVAEFGTLTIRIHTDNGWALEETHVYIGTAAPTKSAPGQFPYKHERLGDALVDEYVISLDGLDAPCWGDLYVAVHAVVKGIDNEYGEETAWGDGTIIRAGKNWAMYFTTILQCETR